MTFSRQATFTCMILETIQSDSFKGLKNLKCLSFNRNKLTSFDHVILTGRVEKLNLSSNNLVSFIITSNNNQVINLDLSSNKLKTFDLNVKFTFLENLNLNNNHITKLNMSRKITFNSLLFENNNNIIELTNLTFKNVFVILKLNLKKSSKKKKFGPFL